MPVTHKLNYRIVGCNRQQEIMLPDTDQAPVSNRNEDIPIKKVMHNVYDVEWTHAAGPVTDTVLIPTTHPPEIEYEEREAGKRAVIKDQVTVDASIPEDMQLRIVAAELEKKRSRLAECLGIEP